MRITKIYHKPIYVEQFDKYFNHFEVKGNCVKIELHDQMDGAPVYAEAFFKNGVVIRVYNVEMVQYCKDEVSVKDVKKDYKNVL